MQGMWTKCRAFGPSYWSISWTLGILVGSMALAIHLIVGPLGPSLGQSQNCRALGPVNQKNSWILVLGMGLWPMAWVLGLWPRSWTSTLELDQWNIPNLGQGPWDLSCLVWTQVEWSVTCGTALGLVEWAFGPSIRPRSLSRAYRPFGVVQMQG